MRHLLVLLVAVGLALVACEKPLPPARTAVEYTRNAKRAYDKALEAYFDKDWEHAIELFGEVKRAYGYSRYARLAELRIADAQFRQKKFSDAVSAYKAYVHDYPNDPEVPYARYKIVKSLFDDASESLLLPPLEERDLVNIEEARGTIQDFVADYPADRRLTELEYMLEVVTGLLARHELYVARFYLREQRYDAAVARIDRALAKYPNSGLEAEALVLLGETYLRMKKLDRARLAFEKVVAQYPASPFVIPARRFLEQMGS
jgi:outer membrane protein assembly factor BamD